MNLESRRKLLDSEESNDKQNLNKETNDKQNLNTNNIEQLNTNNTRHLTANEKSANTDLKKKKKKIQEEDMEKYVQDVITFMKSIYKQDLILNKEKKPALSKIENINLICSKIIRKDTNELFVKSGILKEIKTWLEPLPDKTLPNQKIKKALLDLLNNLKISKIDLLDSGIGKIIHFYSKNTRESKDIRKTAINLVKKWKTIVIAEECEE